MGRNRGVEPPQPPEGILIEDARSGAGLTIKDAALLAGMSDRYWSYVVRGWRIRDGQYLPVVNQDRRLVARMAMVVGLPAQTLIQIRPDVTAEMLRRQAIDAPSDVEYSPARLAVTLTELRDYFGQEVFDAARSLMPPPPSSGSTRMPKIPMSR